MIPVSNKSLVEDPIIQIGMKDDIKQHLVVKYLKKQKIIREKRQVNEIQIYKVEMNSS